MGSGVDKGGEWVVGVDKGGEWVEVDEVGE